MSYRLANTELIEQPPMQIDRKHVIGIIHYIGMRVNASVDNDPLTEMRSVS
jgi:hypothetical protein